eukprot:TRINITY_DN31306_c0_g2_i1.p1 TRINITY_DN31306_c0_g2~~TRINITY_DN31306_c0_g2_i1.p1  ORF type:complete len:170 (-),score=33.27 TRINITY_DN31306_c0_g2_i1:326-835(-)
MIPNHGAAMSIGAPPGLEFLADVQEKAGKADVPGICDRSMTASTGGGSLFAILREDPCETSSDSADEEDRRLSSQPAKVDPLALEFYMMAKLMPEGQSICDSLWPATSLGEQGYAMTQKTGSEPVWLPLAPSCAGTAAATNRVKLFCQWCGSKRASEVSIFCTSCGEKI